MWQESVKWFRRGWERPARVIGTVDAAVGLGLLAEGVAILAFYYFDWSWLRTLQTNWMRAILPLLGCSVGAFGNDLALGGRIFGIDRDCTYIDLILCSLPLLWRPRRGLIGNVAFLAIFAGAVTVLNLGRAILAVYVTGNGGSWFWSHDAIDYLLWYPTLGSVALSWIRSLKTSQYHPGGGISGSGRPLAAYPLIWKRSSASALEKEGTAV